MSKKSESFPRYVKQAPYISYIHACTLPCDKLSPFLRALQLYSRYLVLSQRRHSLFITSQAAELSNLLIVIVEINVPRPPPVRRHKLLIALGSRVDRVPAEHALQAHAYALDVLHGRPALLAEEVEADDAVGVDVRVHWDAAILGGGGGDRGWRGGECDFWWFW